MVEHQQSRSARIIWKIRNIPFYVRGWRVALGALEHQDWDLVIVSMHGLHERDLATGISRHWLGTAYTKIGKWELALSEFQEIDKPLKKVDTDTRRCYNHLYCLLKLDRVADAQAFLKQQSMEPWPAARRREIEELVGSAVNGSLSFSDPAVRPESI
jgi:hypothetical protein